MSIIAVKGLKPLSFTIIDPDNEKNMVNAKGEEAKRKEPEPENILIKTVVFILSVGSFRHSFIHSSVRPSTYLYISVYRSWKERMNRTVSLNVKDNY